jgi:Helix-turn-helix domain
MEPSVASDLKLTPQAKTVLLHLKRRGKVSPYEAMMVYGISRLASCIHEIRRSGYDVFTDMRCDDQGFKYASYKLATGN